MYHEASALETETLTADEPAETDALTVECATPVKASDMSAVLCAGWSRRRSFIAETFSPLAHREVQEPGAALQRDLPPAGGIEGASQIRDRADARTVDLPNDIALLKAEAFGL